MVLKERVILETKTPKEKLETKTHWGKGIEAVPRKQANGRKSDEHHRFLVKY